MPKKQPQFCHHKQVNQGYVTLGGRRIYLGRWGLDETEEAYYRVVAEYIASGSPPVKPEQEHHRRLVGQPLPIRPGGVWTFEKVKDAYLS